MEKTLFFHGKTVDEVRYTIAGRIEKQTISIGIAICSLKDQFCKATGRVKAEGRLYSKRNIGKIKQGPSITQKVIGLFKKDGKNIDKFIQLSKENNNLTLPELQKKFNLDRQGEKK